ncbi:MAG: WD40/YVTN/BNR-like repeat-containing protein [Nitrospiria bacterium]
MNQSRKHIFLSLVLFLIWNTVLIDHGFAAEPEPHGTASGMKAPSAWSYSAGINGTLPVTDMVCPTQKVCFASAVNQVVKTTDSGKIFYTVFKEPNVEPGTLSARTSIWFIDSKTGFAGIPGNGYTAVKTRDGGKSWKEFKDQAFAGRFGFFDEMRGISGTQGGLMFTRDGGKSWQHGEIFKNKEGKEKVTLSDFVYSRPSLVRKNQNVMTGFFVVFQSAPSAPPASHLIKTDDGGSIWTIVNSDLPHNLRSVFFKDRDHGWVGTADGHILKTTDGGGTWKDGAVSGGEIRQIQCLTKENCYAISVGMIYLTIDSGNRWTQLQPVDVGRPIVMETIAFMDSNLGLIGGGLAEIKGLKNQAIASYTTTGGILKLNH